MKIDNKAYILGVARNLLIIAQRVDVEDDITGFFVGWIREFSKNFDHVYVITLAKGIFDLPKNVEVYSLGKEKKASKISQFFTFYFLLFTLAPKCTGIFTHMSPIFAVSAWPVAAIFRKKIVLWYLHRSVTLRLKIAALLSHKIVTSTKQSLGLNSNKIIEVGHAIDTDYFKPNEKKWGEPVRIISVARITPAKKYETAIETASILKGQGVNFSLLIVGKPVMSGDVEYFESLKKMVSKSSLEDVVEFVGFVPYSKIADYYRDIDISINLTNGGTDKVVFEAMSAGCIVITSNPAFRQYLGKFANQLLFDYEDANGLADRIKKVATLQNEEKNQISHFLRNSILEHHLLSRTISKISAIF